MWPHPGAGGKGQVSAQRNQNPHLNQALGGLLGTVQSASAGFRLPAWKEKVWPPALQVGKQALEVTTERVKGRQAQLHGVAQGQLCARGGGGVTSGPGIRVFGEG